MAFVANGSVCCSLDIGIGTAGIGMLIGCTKALDISFNGNRGGLNVESWMASLIFLGLKFCGDSVIIISYGVVFVISLNCSIVAINVLLIIPRD